ncbi:MAG: SCO7613 C-terminal domain-containing membrane protein [Actinomycetes bacterium]
MDQSAGAAPLPPLPSRARPPEVLLGVGAVLLVCAAAGVAAAYAGAPARRVLLAVAGTVAAFSFRGARSGLRSSEETLAAAAAGLGLIASGLGNPGLSSHPAGPAALAVALLVLHRCAPTTAVWPLASWCAAQLAVLAALDMVPAALRTATFLGVALVGLCIVVLARRVVARAALVTSAPWWVAGVLGGSWDAWQETGGARWAAAASVLAAVAGLLVARLREAVEPLLGPPPVVPVVAGLVAGTATAGALSSPGVLATTLTGFGGVLLATVSAAYLTGWRRGLLLPVALGAGAVMTVLCVGSLVWAQRWSELSLLLLLTAVPTVLVAVRRPAERPTAVPTAIGCLAGAVLLWLPDGPLPPAAAGGLLTVLYCLAMAAGTGLQARTRSATAGAAAACAVAAVSLLRADGDGGVLAGALGVQGFCTLGWAWRTGRRADADGGRSPAWNIGAGQLVLAGWTAAAAADLTRVEWYSLTAAAGLLVAAGPRLARGPSWRAWGPGLLVAAVPSTVLAVVRPDEVRAVVVLGCAALAMVAAGRAGVRAPLLVGAGAALSVALGLTVRAMAPGWTAAVVGLVLLAIGVLRERRPVAGFGRRLADLR